MTFQNNYQYMLDVLANKRPERLPIYEHIIDPVIMEEILGVEFDGDYEGEGDDLLHFFKEYCRFWQEMTYDTVSGEITICDILPDHGAIYGGRPGPIQTRDDFNKYPWEELPNLVLGEGGAKI